MFILSDLWQEPLFSFSLLEVRIIFILLSLYILSKKCTLVVSMVRLIYFCFYGYFPSYLFMYLFIYPFLLRNSTSSLYNLYPGLLWAHVQFTVLIRYPNKLCMLYTYTISGMLIHRQNSYAPRGKRRTGRREAQSRGPGPYSKNIPCIILNLIFWETGCNDVNIKNSTDIENVYFPSCKRNHFVLEGYNLYSTRITTIYISVCVCVRACFIQPDQARGRGNMLPNNQQNMKVGSLTRAQDGGSRSDCLRYAVFITWMYTAGWPHLHSAR
jgi:hypothetical protein